MNLDFNTSKELLKGKKKIKPMPILLDTETLNSQCFKTSKTLQKDLKL